MAVEPVRNPTDDVFQEKLSVAWIFEESINFYRDHFIPLLTIFVLANAIFYGIQYIAEGQARGVLARGDLTISQIMENPELYADDLVPLLFEILLIFILMALSLFLVSVLFHSIAIGYTNEALVGGHPTLMAALSAVLPTFPRVIGATLISMIVVSLGLVLLIVPGLVLAMMFVLVPQTVILEGRGPIDALSRSNELTSGNKMTIFLFFLFWAVVLLLFSMILGPGGGIWAQVIQIAIMAILGPVMPISTTIIYQRLLPPEI